MTRAKLTVDSWIFAESAAQSGQAGRNHSLALALAHLPRLLLVREQSVATSTAPLILACCSFIAVSHQYPTLLVVLLVYLFVSLTWRPALRLLLHLLRLVGSTELAQRVASVFPRVDRALRHVPSTAALFVLRVGAAVLGWGVAVANWIRYKVSETVLI